MEQTDNKTDKKIIDRLFVTIPPGTVKMRDDRTKEVWTANVDSFLLSKFPVTQDLYELVTGENPSTFKGARLPVETVSWMEAVKFCNKLSKFSGLTHCYSEGTKPDNITSIYGQMGIGYQQKWNGNMPVRPEQIMSGTEN